MLGPCLPASNFESHCTHPTWLVIAARQLEKHFGRCLSARFLTLCWNIHPDKAHELWGNKGCDADDVFLQRNAIVFCLFESQSKMLLLSKHRPCFSVDRSMMGPPFQRNTARSPLAAIHMHVCVCGRCVCDWRLWVFRGFWLLGAGALSLRCTFLVVREKLFASQYQHSWSSTIALPRTEYQFFQTLLQSLTWAFQRRFFEIPFLCCESVVL